MSNGGSFKLLTNDGKQDDMIMATRFLNARLDKIQNMRRNDPRVTDPTPTLVDIEKTHILFVNAHFKPYVAIGYEYQVVTNAKVQLGGQVQFNIPLYGDFIHDMVLHMTLGAVNASNSGNGDKLIRYVEYPGEKICRRTEISVNGNVLDSYDNDVYSFYREFNVTPNKQVGYDRNMGQSEGQEALKVGRNGRASGISEKTQILDGYQTPKTTQPALDLWIPVLFWYSLDVKLSLISVAIPHGQRFVTMQLVEARELLQHSGLSSMDDAPGSFPVPVPDINTVELFVNNIFVNPEIHSIIIKRIGFNLIRVYRLQRYLAEKANDEVLLNQIKWPIETIYCGARPAVNNDVNNVKMASNWNKYTNQTLVDIETGSMDNNTLLLATPGNNPGQAADYTTAFTRLDQRATGLNFATALGVSTTTVLSVTQINTVLTRNGYKPLVGTFANPLAPTNAEVLAALPNSAKVAQYWSSTPSINTLGLKAHGIEIFKTFPAKFYNSYLPLHYGGEHIRTPKDTGKFFIPFNFYPGSYQPSGHINISRAREFYFNYTSSTIGSGNGAEIFFVAIAINFLLISDGSAVLRYAT